MTEDRTPYQSARPHSWGPSRLGHGTSMCSRCFVTDAEAAALGELNDCSQWEEPAPVEAEKTKKTEEHARADSARWVEHIAEIEARGLGRDAKDLDRLRAENERLTAERDARCGRR